MLLLRSLPLLLLLGAPRSFTEGAATALTPDSVLEWQDKGIFVIQSESLKKCIQAGKSALTLENCKPANKHMLWKWVSNHRLFNIGGSGCLGLNLSNPEQLLSIYECDSTHVSLRWRCNRNMITGPLQYTVQVNHNNVLVASWKYLHKWISYMSGGGSICEYHIFVQAFIQQIVGQVPGTEMCLNRQSQRRQGSCSLAFVCTIRKHKTQLRTPEFLGLISAATLRMQTSAFGV